MGMPPVDQPALRVPPVAPPTIPIARDCRCGGMVNPGNQNCNPFLWQPTNTLSMSCYAHGGPGDPCALHILNDAGNGLNKDPIQCYNANFARQNVRRFSDTFFLWDEPDTYGRSYTWAGQEWVAFANRYASSIQLMRQNGMKFASPIFTAGLPGILTQHVNEFYGACGGACSDPNSPAYIDIIAALASCRPSDTNDPNNPSQGCRNAANFFVEEINNIQIGRQLPVYIMGWSRFNVNNAFDELAAMEVIDEFFKSGSKVQRVYWYGAIDNGIGSEFSYLTNQILTGARAGQTLGQVWKEVCGCSDGDGGLTPSEAPAVRVPSTKSKKGTRY